MQTIKLHSSPHMSVRPLKPTSSLKDDGQEEVTLHPGDTAHSGVPEIKQSFLDNFKVTALGFIPYPSKSAFQPDSLAPCL